MAQNRKEEVVGTLNTLHMVSDAGFFFSIYISIYPREVSSKLLSFEKFHRCFVTDYLYSFFFAKQNYIVTSVLHIETCQSMIQSFK